MATEESVLVLSDPRAIRALAHAARQRLITLLYAGEVLTATAASESIGLSPSATSYHMKALERWGIIERGAPGKDGRERPWRAAFDHLRLELSADSRGEVQRIGASMFLEGLDAAIRSWAGGDGAAGASLRRGTMSLTDEEARELNRSIEALINQFARRSSSRNQRGGREPREYVWAHMPTNRADADPLGMPEDFKSRDVWRRGWEHAQEETT